MVAISFEGAGEIVIVIIVVEADAGLRKHLAEEAELKSERGGEWAVAKVTLFVVSVDFTGEYQMRWIYVHSIAHPMKKNRGDFEDRVRGGGEMFRRRSHCCGR